MTTANPPPERVVDWAGLPSDLLALVVQLLSAVPGRVCFRAVCRSWRAADDLHDRRAVARMPPPWVVIPLGAGCTDAFTMLSVPTNQAFSWTPPGGAGLRCVGSSGGWIAGAYIDADLKIRLSLLNPLTDARVDVPATVGQVFYLPNPNTDSRRRIEEVSLCNDVQKVAFSPSPTQHDFAVAVLTRNRDRTGKAMAFTRAGCDGWCAFADLGPLERGGVYVRTQLDVAYHHGKFYYMTMCGQVWVVDMAAPSPSPAPLARFAPTVPGLIYRRHHLAFTGDGALHVVCSSIRLLDSSRVMLVQRYYDPGHAEQGSSSPSWAPATCLRGDAFLVGDLNQTLPVRADGGDGAWLRPDSVYFTNIPLCSFLAESHGCSHGGAWVLHLATGDIRRLTWSKNYSVSATGECYNCWQGQWGVHYSKCVWIMPSMQ